MSLIKNLPALVGRVTDDLHIEVESATTNKRATISQFAAAAAGNNFNFLKDPALRRWGNGGRAAAATMTDGAYDALTDWYSLIQGANPTIERAAGSDGSQYAAKLIAGGTTNRFALAQVVPHRYTLPLQDQTAIFQTRVRSNLNAGAGNNMDLRCALLAWTGTADAVTLEIINAWANSSFTTGNFFASTDLAVVAVSDQLQSAHNTWNDLSATGAIDTNANNLILIVWTEDIPAHAADYLEIAKAGLYLGDAVKFWTPDSHVDPAYDVIHLQDQKSDTTNGGTFTSGSWQTRELNAIVDDTGGHCSLSSNQFTLAAGEYEVIAKAAVQRVAYHRLRIENVDDSVVVCAPGPNHWSSSSSVNMDHATVIGRFQIDAAKAFELQHRCDTTNASFGYGLDDNMTIGAEVFADVLLRKIA